MKAVRRSKLEVQNGESEDDFDGSDRESTREDFWRPKSRDNRF